MHAGAYDAPLEQPGSGFGIDPRPLILDGEVAVVAGRLHQHPDGPGAVPEGVVEQDVERLADGAGRRPDPDRAGGDELRRPPLDLEAGPEIPQVGRGQDRQVEALGVVGPAGPGEAEQVGHGVRQPLGLLQGPGRLALGLVQPGAGGLELTVQVPLVPRLPQRRRQRLDIGRSLEPVELDRRALDGDVERTLRRLETLDRLVVVDSLQIGSSTAGNGQTKLDVDIHARMFAAGTGSPAPVTTAVAAKGSPSSAAGTSPAVLAKAGG